MDLRTPLLNCDNFLCFLGLSEMETICYCLASVFNKLLCSNPLMTFDFYWYLWRYLSKRLLLLLRIWHFQNIFCVVLPHRYDEKLLRLATDLSNLGSGVVTRTKTQRRLDVNKAISELFFFNFGTPSSAKFHPNKVCSVFVAQNRFMVCQDNWTSIDEALLNRQPNI